MRLQFDFLKERLKLNRTKLLNQRNRLLKLYDNKKRNLTNSHFIAQTTIIKWKRTFGDARAEFANHRKA